MTMEQGVDKQALKEKCQEYLQLAKPETGDQERAYITGKMNEMTDTIAWLYGWTGAQVDDFFRDAGRL